MKINKTISSTITTNSGAPQGCVSSLALFSVYTSDCRPVDSFIPKDHLFNCADDKALLGLITENNHQIYETEVQNMVSWCDSNCLQLNTKKTKEMVTDFRKLHHDPPTLSINGEVVERVDSYSYLDIDRTIFFTVKEERRTRGHGVTLAKKQCRLDIRKFSFSQRTVNEWNRLSADCVGASSVNIFKNKIDIYLRRAGYT